LRHEKDRHEKLIDFSGGSHPGNTPTTTMTSVQSAYPYVYDKDQVKLFQIKYKYALDDESSKHDFYIIDGQYFLCHRTDEAVTVVFKDGEPQHYRSTDYDGDYVYTPENTLFVKYDEDGDGQYWAYQVEKLDKKQAVNALNRLLKELQYRNNDYRNGLIAFHFCIEIDEKTFYRGRKFAPVETYGFESIIRAWKVLHDQIRN
jgi:hypothetical protein